MTQKSKEINKPQSKAMLIVTIVVCVLLVPIILYNVIMSVQGIVNPDKYPSLFGVAPLTVTSDVAEPEIMEGDMIFCKVVDPEDIQADDIILCFDTNLQNKGKVLIQKVTRVNDHGNGQFTFETTAVTPKDDNAASIIIPADKLIARYDGARIPVLGAVLGFMGSIAGVLICVGVPLLAVIGYMIYKSLKKSKETDELMAELERLRKEKEAQAQDAPPAKEEAPAVEQAPAVEEAPTEPTGEDGEG